MITKSTSLIKKIKKSGQQTISRLWRLLIWAVMPHAGRAPAKRYAWLFGLGATLTLAHAPFYWVPLLFVVLPVLFWATDHAKTGRQVFATMWWWGLGYYAAGLAWICWALFVDIAKFWWVLPFALVALPAWLALVQAVCAYGVWRLQKKLAKKMLFNPAQRWVMFALAFSLAEWLQSWLLSGFGWHLVGYTWGGVLPMLQNAAVWGVHGLSLLTILWATSPALISMHQKIPLKHKRLVWAMPCVLVMLWVAGALRLTLLPTAYAPNAPIVRLVQPNIPQLVKMDAEAALNNYQRLWMLSTHNAEKVDLIVWPETSITLLKTEDVRRFQADLQAFLKPNQYLATGVLDADIDDTSGKPRLYNRLSFYNNQGLPVASYNKAHLVPFGEYLPFQELWPFDPVASGSLSFSAGVGPQIINVSNLKLNVAPNICYEVVFPGALTQSWWHKPKAPDVFLNVTNDGWYGPTHGPYQHVGIARMRAIEEGVPMVRAANTGISVVYDALGRKLADINLNKEGTLDVVLPQTQGRTIFAILGNAGFGLLWVLFAGWVGFSEHGLKLPLKKMRQKISLTKRLKKLSKVTP